MSFFPKRPSRSTRPHSRGKIKAMLSVFHRKTKDEIALRECLREQHDLRWKMPLRDTMQKIFFRKMATTIAISLVFLAPLCVIVARTHHADDAGLIVVALATAGYVMRSIVSTNRNLNEQFWTVVSRIPAEAQPTVFRPEFFQRHGGSRRACEIMDDLKRKENALREAMEIRSALASRPAPETAPAPASTKAAPAIETRGAVNIRVAETHHRKGSTPRKTTRL